MQSTNWTGFLQALVAGGLVGSVLVPMKYVRKWAWENSWLLFASCAYLLSPWLVAGFSVPNLKAVYVSAGWQVCVVTWLLGCGWGLAVVLFGISVDMAGLSVATALLYGCSVALGSAGALFLVNRGALISAVGARVVLWDFILLVGVWFCAQAGRGREAATANRDRNRLGILLALLAGILSTLFNIVLAYGEPIRRAAIDKGADASLASNAIWALAVSGGSLPSIFWTIRLLNRNKTWDAYRRPGSIRNAMLCVAMGLIWISGTVLYGSATSRLGPLGTVIGWPIYISAAIISGIAWGWFLGEWGGASRNSLRMLWGGVALQIVGIVLLSVVA